MKITIHNPAQLPVIDYRKIIPIQGDLKDLTETNYQKLKKSIEQNGFKIPAFLWKPARNEEVMIDGAAVTIQKGSFYNLDSHQRIRVLTKENATPREIPYVLIHAENFMDAKKTLLLISSQYGTLTAEGFDNFSFDIDGAWIKEVLNFDSIDLDFPKDPAEGSEDNYEIPEDVKTDIVMGDLFQIGQHRLLCGDATILQSATLLMNGKKGDLVFTDPPYGVNYGVNQDEIQKKSGRKFSKTRATSKILNDNYSAKELAEKLWRPAFKNYYENAKNDCSFYMTMCQGGDQMMMMMMMAEHWQIKHELIWVKNAPVFSMGRLDYDYQHEPILYGWKKKHNWYGKGKFLKSIWEINKPHKSDLHPTMKPILLMENALLNSTKEGDIVMDFFLRSGSTMVAAHQINRICCGMEMEPNYCQIIIDRMIALDPSIIIKKNGHPYIKTAGEKAAVKETAKPKKDVNKLHKPVDKAQTE